MRTRFQLGLDIGVASIGWSLIRADEAGQPLGIEAMGVHLFEAGVAGDVERGKDESKAAPRRAARMMRRQLWRKQWRRHRVLHELMSCGLLPPGGVADHLATDAYLKGIDGALRATWEREAGHREAQLLPYRLRAEAARRRLEPVEVGRALYHLAQRRGFLSNRKSGKRDEEEASTVKQGIADLSLAISAAGNPTLGAYFSTLDPTEQRIRKRWTSRQMYLDEFEVIWAAQAKHNACMTPEAKKAVFDAIFFQRPLKSQAHLIGHCDLIPGKRRAPIACRLAQRFRMLQKVNDLVIEFPDRTQRTLTRTERETVIHELEQGDATLASLRSKKVLSLPKGAAFNLERGGEKKLPGLRTEAKIRGAIAVQWEALADQHKDDLIDDLLAIDGEVALLKHLRDKWGLDAAAAKALAAEALEDDRSAHCRAALAKLVVRMEEGTSYATARKEEFPHRFLVKPALDTLRPVRAAVPDLANPTVERALTEVRKLVNAIIRTHGKPERIHVELARDVKKGRKKRQEAWEENRKREAERAKAADRIATQAGLSNPKGYDIEKVLLADECGWKCPYTGRDIDMRSLLGEHPQFDVEHIWPYSVSLDNSFSNKTLCYHEENRNGKRNRTPHQAYYGTPAWDAILQRVEHFKGDDRTIREKLKRFTAEELPDGFSARHLVETRYLSRLAGEYLSELYGGRGIEGQKQGVVVTTGGLTAHLRREWGLSAVLGRPQEILDKKDRTDHRHHAIDALVVALTDQGTVQKLQRAAEQAADAGRRMFAPVDPPWGASRDDFVAQVRHAVDAINVSHRQSRAASGQLHGDTFYSRDLPKGKAESKPRVRRPLSSLTDKQVNEIVDSAVRGAVVAKLAELGENDPRKAFKGDANLPAMPRGDGKIVPIRKARVFISKTPRKVGGKGRERRVLSTPGSNHHTVISAVKDEKGNEKWEDTPILLQEVYRRVVRREPVVDQRDTERATFAFSLAANEFVMVRSKDGSERLCRVLSVSQRDIEVSFHSDARTTGERGKDRIRLGGSALSERSFRKVHITYLGEIRNAGG